MKTALLVIDMQLGMLSHAVNAKDVIKNVVKVIKKARENNYPIFFFKYIDTKKNIKRFNREFWTKKGTRKAELVDDIEIKAEDKVFEKYYYSAFSVRNLDNLLRSKDIKRIWLCGAMSQVCVLSTSKDAYEKDYDVIIIKDAIGAINPRNLEMGLEWMRKYTSQLVSVKELH